MTDYINPIVAAARLVHYKFGILSQPGFYGPNIERSTGRSLLLQNKKADALARALPEPARSAVEEAFARYRDIR